MHFTGEYFLGAGFTSQREQGKNNGSDSSKYDFFAESRCPHSHCQTNVDEVRRDFRWKVVPD